MSDRISERQIFKGKEFLIEGELDDEVKLKLKVFSSFTRYKNPFKDSMQQKKRNNPDFFIKEEQLAFPTLQRAESFYKKQFRKSNMTKGKHISLKI